MLKGINMVENINLELRVSHIINETAGILPGIKFAKRDDLLKSGIDSITMVKSIVRIEDEFGVEIDFEDEEIIKEITIAGICSILKRELPL